MADAGSTIPSSGSSSGSPTAAEDAALQEALAAAHTAVWGYGVVGAAAPANARGSAVAAEQSHRDLRDQVTALLTARRVDPVPAPAGYTLPDPVRTYTDAANLAVTLEDGTSRAWAWVLDQATERSTRELGVAALSAAEVRAVGWRAAAGQPTRTAAFPGLPDA